jgi:hypothetical protein
MTLQDCKDILTNTGTNMIQSKRHDPDAYILETEAGVSQTDQPLQQEAINTVLTAFLNGKTNDNGEVVLSN